MFVLIRIDPMTHIHMMFAERINVDFFHHHHIFTVFIENGITNDITNGVFVTFCKENQCLKKVKEKNDFSFAY